MFTLPLQQPVAIFLLVLILILLGPFVFRRLRIPSVVGMIIAGIAVGPYGLNLLERDASFRIFGEVGILYIMFQAAVEIDMFHLRQHFKKGIVFGILSFIIPMAAGIFGSRYAFNSGWDTAILIATMYASHTLITYPIVSRFGLSGNRGVTIAVCGTIIAVLLALVTLAQVVALKISGSFDWRSVLELVVMMALYMTGVGYLFPWLTRRIFSHNNDSITQFIFILALVFIASLLAQLIGLEAILGAFYAGLVLNKMIPSRSGLMKNLRFVGDAIFIPYFLIGVGMLINVGIIFRGFNVAWITLNMVVIALVSKWLSAFITSRIFGLGRDDCSLMFGLTSGKAAATIAATMIGFKYEIINEDIMNGAVIMILICCIISSFVTARAVRKIRIQITAESLSNDELTPGEYARQLVAVANPVTSEGLMRMALFMRSPGNPNPVVTLFIRNNDDVSVARMGRTAMQSAASVAESMDIELKEIERYDINVVSGLINVSKEEKSTEILIGMHRKANIVDSFFGTMIEQLLNSTNKMVLLSRCFIPVDTVNRIVIIVPENAEYETGFKLWLMRIANLGAQVSARLLFVSRKGTSEIINNIINEEKYAVRHDYRTIDSWDEFILLSGEVEEEDLLVVIGARKDSISYSSDLEAMPGYLGRHFKRHNLLMIYPRQY